MPTILFSELFMGGKDSLSTNPEKHWQAQDKIIQTNLKVSWMVQTCIINAPERPK